MNLTAIAAAVSAAIAGAAGFAVAWNIQAKILLDTRLEHANERIEQQRSARAAIDRATTQVITAQNAAAARNVRIAADSRRAGDSGSGLRSASTAAVRTSAADGDACGAVVAAYGVILDESISTIREMASTADQCISNQAALVQAWPR